MFVAQKINSYIKQSSPNPYCDDCIARELDLNRQQVQQITAALGTTRDFVREDGVCEFCGEEKKVIRRA